MTPLFSREGLARLDAFARPGLLRAFDFDGTLAPIVADPDAAGLPAGTAPLLNELLMLAPVAIITGRSLDDIRRRVGFTPDLLIGNHGIEGLPGWETAAQAHAAMCRDWQAQLAEITSA